MVEGLFSQKSSAALIMTSVTQSTLQAPSSNHVCTPVQATSVGIIPPRLLVCNPDYSTPRYVYVT